MGSKYVIRVDEGDDVKDYYVNSIFKVFKILIKERGKVLYVTKNYF